MSAKHAFRYAGIIAATSTALVACAESPDSPLGPQPAPRVPSSVPSAVGQAAQAELFAAAQGRTERGFEDWILRLEARVPGVGGLFTDSSGTPVLLVQGTTDRTAVVAALREWGADANLDGALRARLTAGRVEFRSATYRFSELVAWEKALLPQLLRGVSALVSTDADEATNRIRVRIADESARGAVTQVLASAGVPAEAVVIEIAERTTALSNVRGTFQHKAGGVQIRNQGGGICTLGFDVSTGTEIGFLTAGHCVQGDIRAGLTGGWFYSPIVATGYEVGQVKANSPWNDTDPLCGGRACTTADVAFIEFNNSTHFANKVFITEFVGANNTGGSITTTGWWTNIQPPIVANVGHSVDKIGRTTGWTRGTVGATCENVVVSTDLGFDYVMLCANRVDNSRVGQGDSGSPTYLSISGGSTTPLYPLGILFAGGPLNAYDSSDGTYYCTQSCHYYYTPWAAINARLGRTFNPAS